MSDYQRVVEDVRSAMHTYSPETLDFVSAAAANYTTACNEVNDRLRHCAELLKKGLRSEALHLCEIEPNLLDATAVLDVADLQQWNEVLFGYGIAPAPPLLMDVAADLNEAYTAEQPLAALLRRHRLLALGQGSLRTRIDCMHNLAQLDKDNRVWSDDLSTFEQQRQNQLRQEAGEALQRADLPRLLQVECEVLQGPWSVPPPPALVQSIGNLRAGLVRQQACQELERLVPDLNQAMLQANSDSGRRIRQQWHAALRIAELPSDSPLLACAARSLNWLGEEDARQEQERGTRRPWPPSNEPCSFAPRPAFAAAARGGHHRQPGNPLRGQKGLSAAVG